MFLVLEVSTLLLCWVLMGSGSLNLSSYFPGVGMGVETTVSSPIVEGHSSG